MALPTASTAGYGYLYTYTAHPNVGCNCLREWNNALHREAYRRGILSSPTPRVIQATGAASASALVHSLGGMYDFPLPDPTRWNSARTYRLLGPKTRLFIALIREMGGFAWARYDQDGRWDGDAWENNEHIHGGLNGCPHLHWQAKNQLSSYISGGDGIGGSDPHYRPSVFRTWKQGIDWANGSTQEDDDVVSDADIVKIARAVRDMSVQVGNDQETFGVAQGRTRAGVRRLEAEIAELRAQLALLAAETAKAVHEKGVQVGNDVEPAGLAIGRTLAAVRRLEGGA